MEVALGHGSSHEKKSQNLIARSLLCVEAGSSRGCSAAYGCVSEVIACPGEIQ